MTAPMDTRACLDHMRWQSRVCQRLGAPLTAFVIEWAAKDLEAGGPTMARLLSGWNEDPMAGALALRFAGGIHVLVRNGQAPALASFYDPALPPDNIPAFAEAMARTVADHMAMIADFLTRPVQTNEMGRSACLLGGFLTVAEETGRPLELLEIGASGGLNLLWDLYHYDLSGVTWGPKDSPIALSCKWRGSYPPLPHAPRIAGRRGCDLNPIDLLDTDSVARAGAYIWPEHQARQARFEAGVALARNTALTVEKADAAHWLTARLAEPNPDRARVVFHSIMWQYMPVPIQDHIRGSIEAAGERATLHAPLAWLRMEPPRPDAVPEVRLTLWPGATTRRLAYCHPHGVDLEWAPAALD